MGKRSLDRIDRLDLKPDIDRREQAKGMLELAGQPLGALDRPVGPDYHMDMQRDAMPAIRRAAGRTIDEASQRRLDTRLEHCRTLVGSEHDRHGGEE